MIEDEEFARVRLSDRILTALELSIEQEDLPVAEQLVNALDMSMTRNTGGGEFIERRDYSHEMQEAMNRFSALKQKIHGAE